MSSKMDYASDLNSISVKELSRIKSSIKKAKQSSRISAEQVISIVSRMKQEQRCTPEAIQSLVCDYI